MQRRELKRRYKIKNCGVFKGKSKIPDIETALVGTQPNEWVDLRRCVTRCCSLIILFYFNTLYALTFQFNVSDGLE